MNSRLLIIASLVVLAKLFFELATVINQCPIVINLAELFGKPTQHEQTASLPHGRLLSETDTITDPTEIKNYLDSINGKGYQIGICIQGKQKISNKDGFLEKYISCSDNITEKKEDDANSIKTTKIKKHSSSKKADTRPSALWSGLRTIIVYLYHPGCGTSIAILAALAIVAIFASTMPEPWGSVMIVSASIVTIINNRIELQFTIWTFAAVVFVVLNWLFGSSVTYVGNKYEANFKQRDRTGKFIKNN